MRKIAFVGSAACLIAILLTAQVVEGEEVGIPDDRCSMAPTNGAAAIGVQVMLDHGSLENGSFGRAILVGVDQNNATLWKIPFPKSSGINSAKAHANCRTTKGRKGVLIDVVTQDPGAGQPWSVQRYRWDGRKLKYIGEWVRR